MTFIAIPRISSNISTSQCRKPKSTNYINPILGKTNYGKDVKIGKRKPGGTLKTSGICSVGYQPFLF